MRFERLTALELELVSTKNTRYWLLPLTVAPPPLIVTALVMMGSALPSVIVPTLPEIEIVLPGLALAWFTAQRSVPALPSSAVLVTV